MKYLFSYKTTEIRKNRDGVNVIMNLNPLSDEPAGGSGTIHEQCTVFLFHAYENMSLQLKA